MSTQAKGYCPLFGNYPKEYNRAVHGPFYPHVDYRPVKDQHFSEVKLGDFKAWFARRNKTPAALTAACSRTMWLWSRNWMDTRRGPFSKGLFQLIFAVSFVNMFAMYGLLRMERSHKYHW